MAHVNAGTGSTGYFFKPRSHVDMLAFKVHNAPKLLRSTLKVS